MEFFTVLLIVFLVAAVMSPKKKKRRYQPKKRGASNAKKPAQRMSTREPKPDPYLYLYEHWDRLHKTPNSTPPWYDDPVTEAQLNRLKEDEIKLPGRPITKGQASDLIGLGEPPESRELEILKFFKVNGLPLKHGSIARIEVDKLLSDSENAKRWAKRPATPIQKEFYRFVGEKVPPHLTAMDAEAFRESLELSDEKEDEWISYETILEEFSDPEFRRDYDLKKPSIPLIRDAIEAKKAEGCNLTDLMADDLVDTLLDLKPDLERN